MKMPEITQDPQKSATYIMAACESAEKRKSDQEETFAKVFGLFIDAGWHGYPTLPAVDKRISCGNSSVAVSVRHDGSRYNIRWEIPGSSQSGGDNHLPGTVQFESPEEALKYVEEVVQQLKG